MLTLSMKEGLERKKSLESCKLSLLAVKKISIVLDVNPGQEGRREIILRCRKSHLHRYIMALTCVKTLLKCQRAKGRVAVWAANLFPGLGIANWS